MGPHAVPRASSSSSGDYDGAQRPKKTSSSTRSSSYKISNQKHNNQQQHEQDTANSVQEFMEKHNIARQGNGDNQELTPEQVTLICQLYDRVEFWREQLPCNDHDFCDYETCRRYLVARQWNLSKALEQLVSTLQWRIQRQPSSQPFWQASKALANPLALSLRPVGWASDGRPILYTSFGQAHDRWDIDANMEHVLLSMEAIARLLRQRRHCGLNPTASTRQLVLVVDFDGFGARDCNPRAAILTAQLLQHYPECLNMVVLLNAPLVFSSTWKLVQPLLDDRVRSKVQFVKSSQAATLLHERLGKEAADWIAQETEDNRQAMAAVKKGLPPKRYWIPPPTDSNQHDARGIASYVHSEWYIKTPGDAYEEQQRGLQPATMTVNTPINRQQLKMSLQKDTARSKVTVKVTSLYQGHMEELSSRRYQTTHRS